MPQAIIDLLKQGVGANYANLYRKGNVIELPCEGDVVVSGDIHGHRRNFERVVKYADLENNPARHVVMQEIIHGGIEDAAGGCLSYKLLFDVVRYMLRFPNRVHVIMGNHDTAYISECEVMKNGKEMNVSMTGAIEREFGESGTLIKKAIKCLLFSQPLAVRCPKRIFISHSLPADRFIDKFDTVIFDRELEAKDIVKPGSAYLLTWGRRHSQGVLDRLAEMLDVDTFILGHQTQENGWGRKGDNLIIIASEHNHGSLISFDLTRDYKTDDLTSLIVPLASIG